MATIYTAAIQELYVAYFNRPADAGGLAYWESVVAANNGDTAAVSAAFAASAEYKAEYDQLTLSGVVTQIYQNLFNRAPEAEGLAYWVAGIQAGNFTIDQAVTVIANGAQGTDLVAFDSKVLVATAFTAALDTDAEKAGYSGDLANAAAKELLAGITTAAQATAAVVPATLDASIAAVVKASVPFTLTTALSDLAAAEDAVDAFLVTADGDDDEDTFTDALELDANVDAVELALETAVPGFTPVAGYVAATPGVQAALLADAIADRNATLVAAQTSVATANANIAKVPGLAAAITNLTAAETLYTASAAANAAANATLAGAVASYNAGPALDVSVDVITGVVTRSDAVVVIEENADGDLVFAAAANLTADEKTALTPLLNATVANEAAQAAEAAALLAQTNAQLTVDRSDYAADAKDELVAVGAAMTIVQIAAGAVPTAAQINTEISALAAVRAAAETSVETAAAGVVTVAANGTASIVKGGVTTNLIVLNMGGALELNAGVDDTTHPGVTDLLNASIAAESFDAAVLAFDTADNAAPALANPLADALTAANDAVDAAEGDIEILTGLIDDLAEAKALVTELEGLEDAVTAAEAAFTENNFAQPIEVAGVVGATSDSDIYMASNVNSTIVNFGLVGDDKLFIGTEYTLNTSTELKTGGNNAVLEVFLIQSGADTIVTLEKVEFGSNSTAEAETTITLTGVNVADVSLANGIITVG